MSLTQPVPEPGVNTDRAIPLDQLAPGCCGVVTAVDAAHDDLHRLQAMGVCQGRRVELVKRGDPLILRVYGSRLGISRRLATMILVEPCPEPRCADTDSSTASTKANSQVQSGCCQSDPGELRDCCNEHDQSEAGR